MGLSYGPSGRYRLISQWTNWHKRLGLPSWPRRFPNSLVGRAVGLLKTLKYYVSQAKPRIVIPKGLAIFLIGDIRISRRVLAYDISPESSKSTNERVFSSSHLHGAKSLSLRHPSTRVAHPIHGEKLCVTIHCMCTRIVSPLTASN
jgi:hypothetical protein